MRVEVVDFPGMRVAGVWHQGPYERISDTFVTMFPTVEALGLGRPPEARFVAVYYDDPRETPDDQLRSLASIAVSEEAAIGDLHEVRLSGGRYLRAEFIGPHSDLALGWRQVGELLTAEGHTPRTTESFEVYVDNDPPPAPARTDLYLPIE